MTKAIKILAASLFVLLFASNSYTKDLSIGLVDLNRALNESEEGIRSKNLLEAESQQKESEIRLQENELRSEIEKYQNNVLLSQDAKAKKEQELIAKEQLLRQRIEQLDLELRTKERQMTETIFNELKTVIRTVSLQGDYDLVLEKNAAEIILFMKMDTVDVTQKVIDHYNSLKLGKK